jgi:hypothetical protein
MLYFSTRPRKMVKTSSKISVSYLDNRKTKLVKTKLVGYKLNITVVGHL